MRGISLPVLVISVITLLMSFFYFYLYVRRPQDKAHGSFALICFLVGLYNIASFALYNSSGILEAVFWQKSQYLLLAGLLVTLVLFCHVFLAPVAKPLFIGTAAGCFAFAVLGITIHGPLTLSATNTMVRTVSFGGNSVARWIEARPGPVYAVQVIFSLVVFSYFLLGMIRTRKARKTGLPLIVFSICIFYAASVNDALTGLGLYSFVYLMEYAFGLIMMSMSLQLLNRFLGLYKQIELLNTELAHEVRRQTAKLRSLNRKLRSLAALDPLTELYNRRVFRERVETQAALARRYGAPFAVLMIDVDHFKKINDTYGHQAGDHVLKMIAEVIKNTVRETDLVCRYGGEEFSVVLPHVPEEGARVAAERIRSAVESRSIEAGSDMVSVTVSIGIHTMLPDDSTDDILREADRMLYAAKQRGRNRIAGPATVGNEP